MPTDDRRPPARDQRRTEVIGSYVDGGTGGIQVGGNLEVTSTVSTAADASLTEAERQLVQAVLDAARSTGSTVPTELTATLRRLDDEIAAEPARRDRVRPLLEHVAYHAGTAGAVLAAAQLALEAMT